MQSSLRYAFMNWLLFTLNFTTDASGISGCCRYSSVIPVLENSLETSGASYYHPFSFLPHFGKTFNALINTEFVKHLILHGFI